MRGAIILGCFDGLVVALLGFGIVLIYKAERFVNLANAQLGLVPAILLAKLVLEAGVNWYLAFVVAIALGALGGAACRRYLIAPLEQSSRTGVMIATLGLSQLLLSLVFFDWVAPDRFLLREEGYPFPFEVFWRFDSLTITAREVLIVVLVPAALVALATWLQLSSFGRTMRAAASNLTAARLAGVDVRRTATVTWAIAGGLSVVAAVLTAPGGTVLEMETLSPTLLFLSLGAAALVGFTSLWGVVAAGLGLGIVEGVGAHLGSSGGVGLASVFATVVIGLLVRSFVDRPTAATVRIERSEEPFRIPEVLRHRWYVRSWAAPLMASAVAIALPFLPWFNAPHRTFVLAVFAVFAVATASITLLSGWSGQISLGQFAFVGVGAFVAARLAPRGWSLLAIIVVAALTGAVTALIVGLPAARSRGLSLAVTTLGFALVAPAWLFTQSWVAPASTISSPAAYAPGVGRLATQRSVYLAALGVLIVVALGLVRLRRSTTGRSILAVRDNERGAAAFGFSPVLVRLTTLAASGALAAIAGVLWLAVHRNVGAASFDAGTSVILLSAAVIGGLGYVRGALIGALGAFGLPLLFEDPIGWLLPDTYQAQLFFGGLGLIAVQVFNPGGIASARRGWLQRQLERLATRSTSRPGPTGATPAIWRPEGRAQRKPDRSTEAALSARDISVHFGGVRAVDAVTLEVAAGEVVGVIGANGAGKTTLLDAICGLAPAQGNVMLFGRDVSPCSPTKRAQLGLRRGFQDARLFPSLTVLDTIELALTSEHGAEVVGPIIGAPWARLAHEASLAEASAVVERFGLAAWADVPIDRLSTGTRHICEIAAMVAARPGLLVLDEPTSGVAQRETEVFGPLIRDVVDELGCAVLVVEHDMPVVMSLADRIYCLERGRVIAHGTPSEVQRDPAVIASYLGTPRRRRATKKAARTA
ncbi:MAG TPA: ATP-binding cassette domain-containing protein [Acidimicrobiales bacterium]|nr:ATP-binding cassette domain-containing protein [Acidimicrobiales bacterium]